MATEYSVSPTPAPTVASDGNMTATRMRLADLSLAMVKVRTSVPRLARGASHVAQSLRTTL